MQVGLSPSQSHIAVVLFILIWLASFWILEELQRAYIFKGRDEYVVLYKGLSNCMVIV